MKTLVKTYATLVALTVSSLAASFIPLRGLEMTASLGIAGLKATCIGLFFMHLKRGAASDRIVVLTAITFVTLLVAFATGDIATR